MSGLEGRTVLVTGATGFVASRLIPRLLLEGAHVRATSRHPEPIARRYPDVEVIPSDLSDADSLPRVLAGVRVAYYLVHSMSGDDFEAEDRKAASNFLRAAEHAGVERIVYLSGLGREDQELSHHLRSRQEVGALLASGKVPTTELRCAIVIGSGSIAFDMLRYLTERLPAMIAPRWLSTRIQPLAEDDLIRYLVAAGSEQNPGGIVEIGGRDVLTYKEMILGYATERGLRRVIVSVPVLSPRLSSYWVNLVTPVAASIARPLIEGLRNEVIVTNDGAKERWPDIEPIGYREAVTRALDRQIEALEASVMRGGPEIPGTDVAMLSDKRRLPVHGGADKAGAEFQSLGGDASWYPLGWAWWVRARLDDLFGGVGLSWRKPEGDLVAGSQVDWWTVEAVDARALVLRADMKTPGEAWLSFRVDEGDPDSFLQQSSFFRPRGIGGRLYWWLLLPFHAPIFRLMATRLATRMGRS
ncbi:MAG: hypothetical protein QOK47_459 [Actinomycetota bacterium]|nr:hypothetical protein [Actinomycetota bacterium]